MQSNKGQPIRYPQKLLQSFQCNSQLQNVLNKPLHIPQIKIFQRNLCTFCTKLNNKLSSGLMINRALYLKYSSSQNFYYSKKIQSLIEENGNKTDIINFNDEIQFEQNNEYFQQMFKSNQFNDKLQFLTDYYQYHSEVPRNFMPSIHRSLTNYYEFQRKNEYYKVKQILKEEKLQNGEQPSQNSFSSKSSSSEESSSRNTRPESLINPSQLHQILKDISHEASPVIENYLVEQSEISIRNEVSEERTIREIKETIEKKRENVTKKELQNKSSVKEKENCYNSQNDEDQIFNYQKFLNRYQSQPQSNIFPLKQQQLNEQQQQQQQGLKKEEATQKNKNQQIIKQLQQAFTKKSKIKAFGNNLNNNLLKESSIKVNKVNKTNNRTYSSQKTQKTTRQSLPQQQFKKLLGSKNQLTSKQQITKSVECTQNTTQKTNNNKTNLFCSQLLTQSISKGEKNQFGLHLFKKMSSTINAMLNNVNQSQQQQQQQQSTTRVSAKSQTKRAYSMTNLLKFPLSSDTNKKRDKAFFHTFENNIKPRSEKNKGNNSQRLGSKNAITKKTILNLLSQQDTQIASRKQLAFRSNQSQQNCCNIELLSQELKDMQCPKNNYVLNRYNQIKTQRYNQTMAKRIQLLSELDFSNRYNSVEKKKVNSKTTKIKQRLKKLYDQYQIIDK